MSRQATVALYAVLMVVVIVGADFLFFRDHTQARLIANIAIVLVFAAGYFVFLRR